MASKTNYFYRGDPEFDFMAAVAGENLLNHLDVEYITIHSDNRNETEMKWQKGQSGNPAGRPKEHNEVRRYIFEKTNFGKDLVDFMLKVAYDKDEKKHGGWAAKERMVAIKWLSDYSLGRPAESLDLTGDGQSLSLVDIVACARKIERDDPGPQVDAPTMSRTPTNGSS